MRGHCVRKTGWLFLTLMGLIVLSGAVAASDYPTKPVRILVGFSPGGGVDMLARVVGVQLAETLHNPMVVENRPGANGKIAAEIVTKAPADGYTLLAVPGNYIFALAMGTMSLDITKVLSGISQIAKAPLLLVVHPSVPVSDVRGLIKLAKAKPGQLTYASGGIGGAGHLATELFSSMTSISLIHVPYKGIGPAITDLIGGHVSVCFCTLPASLRYAKVGKLRALAVTSSQRSPAAPDIPTVQEAGVAGYEMNNWWGLLAPLGTPPEILDQVSKEVKKALAVPGVLKQIQLNGAQPIGSSPKEFDAFLRSEASKWTKVVQAAGLRSN